MILLLVPCILAAASAVSIPEPLILEGSARASKGATLNDPGIFWKRLSDSLRYNPDTDNEYHLFTRVNPTVSQPIVQALPSTLHQSNYDPRKRTAVVIHGMDQNALAHFNQVVIPALLTAEDLNVINVDWRIGAASGAGLYPTENALRSGVVVANFINWLMAETGQDADSIIIVGFSLGGLKSGVVGRNVRGEVSYIVALDPLHRPGPLDVFRPSDGQYTEAIRSAVDSMGQLPAAHVDFYVNGGDNNPGCGDDFGCNHNMAYLVFAESLVSGGFTARRCATLEDARAGTCHLPGDLQLGGLQPKTGSTGLFHLRTNASPPYSMG